jgi:DNA mismatch repair protein MutL
MSELIKLLPDHIANQIAAGEVVQRPASVVKELVENAIDAGATKINLIAKDGGKTLIQVIDNGSGMSAIDARMCFERHATSKISTADDLFHLHTKGFRGEAMASIAAIAHVELKTKLETEDLGTLIINEGSKVKSQEPCSASTGTSISVKNLFFNIPARRNFLGSNLTEYKHVLNEFMRVALVHHEVAFTFHHNGDLIYNLPIAGLRQRIVGVFGDKYNNRLVPVNEETDIFKVTGFVTKPEFARTSRDQMFLFVNNRYFKDTYFNHAIQSAFDGMIPSKKFPPYFLYFEVPTESIDVNVHPTKTEIKFENRQEIYSILRASIKQALGQFNISSTLDFEQENTFNIPSLKKGEIVDAPVIKVNDNFNPFKTNSISQTTSFPKTNSPFSNKAQSQIKPDVDSWENFYEASKSNQDSETQLEFDSTPNENGEVIIQSKMDNSFESNTKPPYQIHDKYIISPIKSGFIMIDQYRAHSRILFDNLMNKWSDDVVKSQQLLFPESFEISATDMVYFNEIEDKLKTVGFDLTVQDNKIINVTGIPVDYENESPKLLIENVLAKFKESQQDQDVDFKAVCAKAFANAKAIKKGVKLTIEEMQHLINELFGSSNPQTSPSGKTIIVTYTLDDITKKFN